MGNLIDLVDLSFTPQEEIVLTDRCKNARSKWWRLRRDYDYRTGCVVRSMNYQKKTYEEISAYVKKRNEDFNKNHPYPVDEIKFTVYTDYVPF